MRISWIPLPKGEAKRFSCHKKGVTDSHSHGRRQKLTFLHSNLFVFVDRLFWPMLEVDQADWHCDDHHVCAALTLFPVLM
jgi:hypothetical protein